MWDKKSFWNNFLNFIIYNMYSLHPYGLFLNLFMWDIKTLNIFFFIFQVNSGQPVWLGTQLLGLVDPRARFNNYEF
jgi:hypothetical protein